MYVSALCGKVRSFVLPAMLVPYAARCGVLSLCALSAKCGVCLSSIVVGSVFLVHWVGSCTTSLPV